MGARPDHRLDTGAECTTQGARLDSPELRAARDEAHSRGVRQVASGSQKISESVENSLRPRVLLFTVATLRGSRRMAEDGNGYRRASCEAGDDWRFRSEAVVGLNER